MGSGPCQYCVPDSHPYPHCKPDDFIQRSRPWFSRDCSRECPQPETYCDRRGSCSRTGDHCRRGTYQCCQRNLGDPPRIDCRCGGVEHPYAPSPGMVGLRTPLVLLYTHRRPGPNTTIQSAAPALARCSPHSARHQSWTLHCTVLTGSVSSLR